MAVVEQESDTSQGTKSPLTYRVATFSDCEQLSILVNEAYRGESSRQGWTTSESFMSGQRTNPDKLKQIVADENSVILLFFDPDSQVLIGAVLLQDISGGKSVRIGYCVPIHDGSTVNKILLSMLTVRPDLQARGYGKFIMSIAEQYARDHWHAQVIEMSVFDCRQELVAYYQRRGYVDTGRRQMFPEDDPRHGIPKKTGLQLCILVKNL